MNKRRTLKESLADKNYVMGVYNKMSESEKIKWKKAVKECLEENPRLKSNVNFYKFMTGFGIILLIVAFATGGYALAALPALGAFGMAMDERTFNQLRKCVRAKMELSDETEEDLPSTEDKPIEESKRKKVVRMTESELIQLLKKVIKEEYSSNPYKDPKMADYGFDNEHGELGPDELEDYDDYHQDVEDFLASEKGQDYERAKKRFNTTSRMERTREKREKRFDNLTRDILKDKVKDLEVGSDEWTNWADDLHDKWSDVKNKKSQKKDQFTPYDKYDVVRKNR